jgi:transposase
MGKNVIRAITREAGIKLGTPSRKEFAPRVREMAGSEPELMAILEPLPAVLASMIEALARLTRRVLDIVKNEASCKKLMTAPSAACWSLSGIGSKASWPSMALVRSRRWLSMPPSNSRNASPSRAMSVRISASRHDWPEDQSSDLRRRRGQQAAEGRYQSGETDITGKISRCGDELARTALYEAAHSLLVRSRKWSSLRAWGLAVAERRGMAKAKIAVARKLAVILHGMWIDDADVSFAKQT